MAGNGAASPWDLPTPRKPQSRADLLRSILPASDVPDSYIEAFDAIVREHGSGGGKVASAGAMRVLAAARLDADAQAKIMSIITPGGGEVSLGRNEFNVLLGLTGLAQEGETVSLDGIDERRRSECLSQPAPPTTVTYIQSICLFACSFARSFHHYARPARTTVPYCTVLYPYIPLPTCKRLNRSIIGGGVSSLSLIYDRHPLATCGCTSSLGSVVHWPSTSIVHVASMTMPPRAPVGLIGSLLCAHCRCTTLL
jgi:hypothetical protein